MHPQTVFYEYTGRFLGTRVYSPPEFFTGDDYILEGVDTWAMGVTLFEMLMGFRPFADSEAIKTVTFNYTPETFGNVHALVSLWPAVYECLLGHQLSRAPIEDLKRLVQPDWYPVYFPAFEHV